MLPWGTWDQAAEDKTQQAPVETGRGTGKPEEYAVILFPQPRPKPGRGNSGLQPLTSLRQARCFPGKQPRINTLRMEWDFLGFLS